MRAVRQVARRRLPLKRKKPPTTNCFAHTNNFFVSFIFEKKRRENTFVIHRGILGRKIKRSLNFEIFFDFFVLLARLKLHKKNLNRSWLVTEQFLSSSICRSAYIMCNFARSKEIHARFSFFITFCAKFETHR